MFQARRIDAPATTAALRVRECDAAALLADEGLHLRWQALAGEAAEANAFAEPWFMLPSLRHFPLPAQFRMLVVEQEGGALAGLLPLGLEPRYGRIPLAHVQNWLHYHSFLGTPLVRAGSERAFWTAILTYVDRAPWATGLLHLCALVEGGPVHVALVQAAAALRRPCDTVHRMHRALLDSPLSPSAYYEATVRKKKRKEIARQRNRLSELGTLAFRRHSAGEPVDDWCEAYLRLERSGWKGEAGTALGEQAATAQFFRDVIAGAAGAGRLELLSLELDGRPIAMLANFLTPPGSFSFKIAFDEAYARYSPGVLIEIENLAILEADGIAWMDSCAVEGHPMIDSLWAERRTIVRVTLPLAGLSRRATFGACRAAERASARLRRFRTQPQRSAS